LSYLYKRSRQKRPPLRGLILISLVKVFTRTTEKNRHQKRSRKSSACAKKQTSTPWELLAWPKNTWTALWLGLWLPAVILTAGLIELVAGGSFKPA
jgi:hypothetical protein